MIKTCSKESGQRLVELGVKPNCRFYHWYDELLDGKTHNTDGCTPAYTACELGEMLRYFGAMWNSIIQSEGWLCIYYDEGREHWEKGDTEAEARALMLIWLLENGHITKEQCNA